MHLECARIFLSGVRLSGGSDLRGFGCCTQTCAAPCRSQNGSRGTRPKGGWSRCPRQASAPHGSAPRWAGLLPPDLAVARAARRPMRLVGQDLDLRTCGSARSVFSCGSVCRSCVTVTTRLASTHTALVSKSLVGLCFALSHQSINHKHKIFIVHSRLFRTLKFSFCFSRR